MPDTKHKKLAIEAILQAATYLYHASLHFNAARQNYHANRSQQLSEELLAVARKIKDEDPEEIKAKEQEIFEEVMKKLPPCKGES